MTDEEKEDIQIDQEQTSVAFGGTVKALPDGKVGGYLVRFSTADDPDLTGDFFSKETDLGEPVRLPVLYHHGMDEVLKRRRIGTADTHVDEIGLWIEAQLEMRDEYEKRIYQMAQDGKLGWSSGAAAHVVEKRDSGKAAHITQWYIAEASLTPTPAEPRNSVIPLKSLLTEGEAEAAQAAPSEAEATSADSNPIQPSPVQGEVKMEMTPEIQALMESVAEDAVKKFRESEPATQKAADIQITKDEADQPWKSSGEFFKAVKNATLYPHQFDRRLLPLKATGLNEATPSEGGLLVPEETSAGIYEHMWQEGTLLAQFNPINVSGNSLNINAVDETSRADGSRYGGVRGYWLAEGATKTASKPAFRQVELKLKKVAALVYATDELLEDTTALESWINNTVPKELKFRVEDAIINGTGVGMPLGILTSPACSSVTRTDANEIDAYDIGRMWAGRLAGYNDYIWIGNQNIFPQMLNLVVGTTPVFLPAGGMSGMPYATLLGRPYFDTEYNPALGTAGDLLLASPSAYGLIQKAGGVQSASSIHVAFTADESVFRFVYRVDGQPMYDSTVTGNDGGTYSPFVVLTATT